ncbi:MAG: hypothetical protein QM820_30795 [Minicystis sp.]
MTAPQLAPGTVVAQKYQLGACLGYAGSSATYQAASAEGREVVLKIFDPAIRQRADIMAAIEQTYAATNALPQDVAVPLLDAGYDASTGAPFSVSERIPFPSLLQLAMQRPLTPEEVSNVLAVMAQLLDRAHARQLFHHAIKPTNVFVGFAQGYGVRVTDFGAGLPRTAVPTQEGYALAAPWMAPEQVQATVPAGGPADVFSAALLAFFALTGRSYWRSCQGEINLAGWQQELLGQRTPPSARAMQLGVTLSSAFDGVLGCALSVDPNQRYRSVGEFAAALDGVVSGKAPESQATMAFPAGSMGLQGGGGEYPPPPPPTGGMPQGGPRQPSSPALMTAGLPGQYGLPPQQMPQQGGQPQDPGAAGYPGAGPYVSNPAAQAPQNGNLGETASGRPIDPAIHQRRPPASRLAPILVAAVAVLLLGGAAAAFVVLGRKPAQPPTTATSASAPAPEPAPTTSATASAAPADTGSAAPADTGSAAPANTGAPAASGEPDVPPVESTLACDPECDEIKLDDKPIELGKPLVIPAGKHTVVASKAGFVTVKEKLEVKQDEKVEKTFKLKEKPTATGPAVPANNKPCGKFLKRCK